MTRTNKIYIIGFMGSGKTTIGIKLASMLNWSFTDLDRQIEEHAAMKITQIFSDKGENYFRETETLMLKKMRDASNVVVSTGGGTPVFGDNMDYMLSTGLTIYLKLTPAQLRSRLHPSDSERPLISNLNSEELLSFIEERLLYREKWYCRADLIINGFDTDMRALYSEVSARLLI